MPRDDIELSEARHIAVRVERGDIWLRVFNLEQAISPEHARILGEALLSAARRACAERMGLNKDGSRAKTGDGHGS